MSCNLQSSEELDTKQRELSTSVQFIEKLSCAKEQFEQNLTRCQLFLQQMQNQMNSNGMQNQALQQMGQCDEQYKQNRQHLSTVIGNLNVASEKFVIDLDAYITLCESLIMHWTKDELISWKRQQKCAQYGNPESVPSVVPLCERYTVMTEYVFTAWKCTQRVCNFLKKLPNFAQQIDNLLIKVNSCFYQLLNTSFLIIQQPPIIAKNMINVRVGLLGAIDKFGFESQRTSAKCRIISEEAAGELRRSPDKIDDQKIKTVGTLKDNKTPYVETDIERLGDNVLGFDFKHLKIRVDSRKKEAKNGEAIKRKYYLLIDCTVNVGEQRFKVFTVSLPFVVSVHGSQDNDLWAKAFWDMAFSDGINDIPMFGRTKVAWSELSRALKTVFTCIMYANTDRKPNEIPKCLTDEDMQYVKARLSKGYPDYDRDPLISWDRFYLQPLRHMTSNKELDFSFWEWFFRIADMLQEKAGHETKVKTLWNAGHIEGFLSKSDAERRLQSCQQPTFLLRFSDNNLGSIGVVVLYENREIDHLAPFTHKEEINDKQNLPFCILHCVELTDVNYIYPNREKKQIDQQPAVRQATNKDNSGYSNRSSKVNVYGDRPTNRKSSESNPCTPYGAMNSPKSDYMPNGTPCQQSVSPSYFDTQDFQLKQAQSAYSIPVPSIMPNPASFVTENYQPNPSEDIQMSEEDLDFIWEYLNEQPDFSMTIVDNG